MSTWAVRTRPWVIEHSIEVLGGVFLYVAWGVSILGTVATVATFACHSWSFRRAESSTIKIRYLFIIALPLVSAVAWCLVVLDLWTATPWQLALDVYEPLVIHQFFKVILDFAGGEARFVELLSKQPAKSYYAVPDFLFRYWPLSSCRVAETPFRQSHVTFARRGVQVFWVVQIVQVVMEVLYATFQLIPRWMESLWRVAVVLGTCFMFYGLVVLCHACYKVLSPYNIPGKLITLKGTVGLLLGQRFILTIVSQAGALPTSFWGTVLPSRAKTQQHATLLLLQGLLACVEMPFVAVGGLWWWPAEDCRSGRHLTSESGDSEHRCAEKEQAGTLVASVPSPSTTSSQCGQQTDDVGVVDGVADMSHADTAIEMGVIGISTRT